MAICYIEAGLGSNGIPIANYLAEIKLLGHGREESGGRKAWLRSYAFNMEKYV
jgi:hypothetical protein